MFSAAPVGRTCARYTRRLRLKAMPMTRPIRHGGSLTPTRPAPSPARLPARQREAVQHFVLEERSLADITALTRRTKGSLTVNLHRALKALRSKMEFGE
jgi:hypothetical protein